VGESLGTPVVGSSVGIGAGTAVGAGEYETWKLAESLSPAASQVSVSTYSEISASPGTVCVAAPSLSTVSVATGFPSASVVATVNRSQRAWSPR
jgi:hypothetical protein